MTDRVVQRKFMNIEREKLANLLSIVPREKRGMMMKEIKGRNYNSVLRYFLRNHLPHWGDLVSEDYSHSVLRSLINVQNARRDVGKPEQIYYSPLWKRWSQSKERIDWAFRCAHHSGVNIEGEMTAGKTKVISSSKSGKRFDYKVAISPAYSFLIDKIGISVYKKYVILDGFLVTKPFEGGEVWHCTVEDLRDNKSKGIYVGRSEEDFVAHTNLSACITALEKVLAKKCLVAFGIGDKDN